MLSDFKMSPKDRSIELTLISASNLKKVRALGQQKSYIVAYIYTDHKFTSNVDNEGGLNPTWNFHLKLDCEEALFAHHGSYLNVEIYSRGHSSNSSSDTLIGTVSIPLRDLDKDVRCHVEAEPMSFQVRRPSGTVKGVLNVAIKLGALHDKRSEGRLSSHAPEFSCKRVDQAVDVSCDCEACR